MGEGIEAGGYCVDAGGGRGSVVELSWEGGLSEGKGREGGRAREEKGQGRGENGRTREMCRLGRGNR